MTRARSGRARLCYTEIEVGKGGLSHGLFLDYGRGRAQPGHFESHIFGGSWALNQSIYIPFVRLGGWYTFVMDFLASCVAFCFVSSFPSWGHLSMRRNGLVLI